ncbi:MAG: TetR/AcrR family transcriptional regulator [Nostoc sp.]|uniref:TetR/AcrR family transcriptional regulator n=1 Tax=Nostoc sp. TaxID=1180 RepID=UPI002FF8B4F2
MSKQGSKVKKHGPGRPRADERDLRNEAILEAATAVFLEQGFARASTDEIANRAGASKQTLYSLYPSKAALFAALMKRRSEKLVDPVASAILRQDAPAHEVLYQYGLQVLRANLSDNGQQLQRRLIAEAPVFCDLANAFWQNGPGWGREIVKQYLESLVQRQVLSINNTDLAADHFMSIVFGWPMLRASFQLPSLFQTDEALAEWVQSAVDVFLRAHTGKE